MSADRDVTRIVRSWLHEDAHEDADRILNLVLDEIDTTPQRRASWLARRTPTLNNYARFGFIAAAVALAAVIGIGLFGNSVGDSEPTPTASPTPSLAPSLAPSPSPTPISDPIVGTWMTAEVTCEQQIRAVDAAGFTAEQTTQSGLDPTCADGATYQISLGFLPDGRLVVENRGVRMHPARYRISGDQTFESTEVGTPVCLTYGYAIDGDQLTIEITDYRCVSSDVAPVPDQVNLTAIFEASPFTRQP
jgi:hypothetical protein